jgi:hypothetical protein
VNIDYPAGEEWREGGAGAKAVELMARTSGKF